MRRGAAFVLAALVAIGGVGVVGSASAEEAAPHTFAPDPAEVGVSMETTPMGAIRAGTANRFIPEWDGGLSTPVKGFDPRRPHPDPFFEDARWFTVTRDELDRYKVRLSWGLRELLGRSERFEVPVYPGRRSAAAPLAIYNASVDNRRTARLSENGLVVSGARVGIPFPEPENGAQAMWNHLLRWRGGTVVQLDRVVLPDAFGKIAISLYREDLRSDYGLGETRAETGLVATRYRRSGLMPDGVVGANLLITDSLDPLRAPRSVWYVPPGKTKAVRAPDFAHATPDPAAGGVRTADMLDMFSGALDWYEFNLIGRRAMYVPYNAYRVIQPAVAPEDFLWAEHPNPSFLRYELHRVWIVEAKLKRGYRHPFRTRVYYLDEDSWQILMAEHYDWQYRLARYAEAHAITYSQVPLFAPVFEITYDFVDNRYVVSGRDNQGRPPIFGQPFDPAYFEPSALEPRRGPRF